MHWTLLLLLLLLVLLLLLLFSPNVNRPKGMMTGDHIHNNSITKEGLMIISPIIDMIVIELRRRPSVLRVQSYMSSISPQWPEKWPERERPWIQNNNTPTKPMERLWKDHTNEVDAVAPQYVFENGIQKRHSSTHEASRCNMKLSIIWGIQLNAWQNKPWSTSFQGLFKNVVFSSPCLFYRMWKKFISSPLKNVKSVEKSRIESMNNISSNSIMKKKNNRTTSHFGSYNTRIPTESTNCRWDLSTLVQKDIVLRRSIWSNSSSFRTPKQRMIEPESWFMGDNHKDQTADDSIVGKGKLIMNNLDPFTISY